MLTFVMVYDGAGFIQGLRDLGDLISRHIAEIPKGTAGMLIQLFLLSVLSAVCTNLQIYLAISLGHLAKKNRVAMSVIAFVGINVAISLLLSAITPLFGRINVNVTIETFDELAKMIGHYGSIALWTAIGWTAVKSAAFFFGSDLILSKKLNLE